MKEHSLYLIFSGGAFVMAWLQYKQALQSRSVYKNVEDATGSSIDVIAQKQLNSFFEFNLPAMTGPSLSPITSSLCAVWEFEIVQTKDNATPTPVVIQSSTPAWIFFESNVHILGVKFFSERIKLAQTFIYTSILDMSLPPELSRFLDSKEFKSQLENTVNHLAFLPTFGTTFCESIVPAGTAVHVFGRIRALQQDELGELEVYKNNLGLKKPILPLTIGGDEFYMAFDNEKTLLRRLRQDYQRHLFFCLFSFIFAVGFLFQFYS